MLPRYYNKTIYQFVVSTTNVYNKDNVHSGVIELTDKDGNLTGYYKKTFNGFYL